MFQQMFVALVLMAIALNACSYGRDEDSTSAMCNALADGDKELAATLVDPIAQQQSDPEWQENINNVILWLEEQDCVQDALSDYPIIETLPIQTEIVVKLANGTTEILDLYVDEQSGTIWVNRFH